MIVTIHQPEHLPWLGFFDKARQADTLVLLDHVQFRKNYFQNRNRIRTAQGEAWITVPVLTKGLSGQPINRVQVNNDGSPRWGDKCCATIRQAYQRAAFWNDHAAFVQGVFSKRWELLCPLNVHLILYFLDAFGIRVRVLRSSELPVEGERSALILDICKRLGATAYLSGVSGVDYLDLESFGGAGIEVRFQVFHHPIYRQLHEPFLPCLSALDLLLNHGPRSSDIIRGVGVETLAEVFK